ncbi:MAG: mechanosensitive ion channel family protein [Chloroflexi bacterium]|nr:mechanosensitive ion channel family protein [Chloroflexota bacterium]
MPNIVIHGSPLWEGLRAAATFAAFFAVAWLANFILNRVAKHLAGRSKTTLDDKIIEAVRLPIFLFVLVQGALLALTSVSFLDQWQRYINQGWIVAIIVVATYAARRIFNALILWYGEEIGARTGSDVAKRLPMVMRRVLNVLLYAVAALLILDYLGIPISPLLAGLGIGGLAAALAFQPTLSNFFAGTYIMTDGAIKPGDYIEMDGGVGGTVVDIGWRTTKVRNIQNNLVIIPNSKLADAIVTNFQAPTPEMNTIVTGGVSYESDLAHVEKVILEVASEVIRDVPEAVKDATPAVGFDKFDDSNINFWVFLRAKDRGASFKVKSELIKRLHARFAREGIEINYPVRKLVHARTDGLSQPAGHGRVAGPEEADGSDRQQ